MSGDTITKKRNDSLLVPCDTADKGRWRDAARQGPSLIDWVTKTLNAAAKAHQNESAAMDTFKGTPYEDTTN